MKKIISFIVVLAMMLSVSSVAFAAGVEDCPGSCMHVAAVGTTHYDTFGEALNAAIAGPNKTVTIIGEVEGFKFTNKNCEGVTIEGSDTGKVTGTFNVDGGTTTFKDATIKNLKFDGGNIVFSTATVSFENFTITGCEFDGKNQDIPAISINRNSTAPIKGADISNNKISNYGTNGIHIIGGSSVTDDIVTIKGNEISNVGNNGIQIQRIENLSIESNEISNTGGPLNFFASEHVVLADNDITLAAGNKWVITYVEGTVEVKGDNAFKDADGNSVALSSYNCHSNEGWDDNDVVIIDGEKGSDDKYVSGSFVGSENGVKNLLSDVLAAEITDADGNTVYVVGADDIEEAAKDGGVTINIIQTSTTAEDNVLEGLPAGTKVVNNDEENSVVVNGQELPAKEDGATESPEFIVPAPAPKPASTGNGISVKYNGGNSFSTSKSDVPTGVEIDGVAVPFTGTGSNFTVGCVDPGAKWVTVRWNSTSVTTNFTPDALVECSVSIPKTGDMPLWAAVLALFGF